MADPASRNDVAHLFGRAAFGATQSDLDTWAGQEYATVVDALFPPLPASQRVWTDDVTRTQLETTRGSTSTTLLRPAQQWWMERMHGSLYPLEERMTLFWHDHFATGFNGPPNVDDMMLQNTAIRNNALGDLRVLLNTMTINGAMLYWLSGYLNRVNAINENYGREFFELFTLGTLPQVYSENDIRQAARAFTGWTVNSNDRTGVFTAGRHDSGSKSVLGRSWGNLGAEEYKQVTEAALAQPVAPYFIAFKLVQNFGYLPQVTDLLAHQDTLIDKVAAALKPAVVTDPWNIAAAVKVMLNAPEWRFANTDPTRMGVRQPVELAVHLAKLLRLNTNQSGLLDYFTAAQKAGQAVFQPPNVGGWPVGKKWLSQPSNLARYEGVNRAWFRWNQQEANTRPKLPASTDIAAWTAFMGLGSLSANTAAQVASYLADRRTPAAEATRQQNVFVLMGTSPDWQVM